jgi:hypothetical protein
MAASEAGAVVGPARRSARIEGVAAGAARGRGPGGGLGGGVAAMIEAARRRRRRRDRGRHHNRHCHRHRREPVGHHRSVQFKSSAISGQLSALSFERIDKGKPSFPDRNRS